MNKIISILSTIPLFNGFNLKQILEINNICIHKYYSKGDVIFIEGDKAEGFFIIIKGKIKIFKMSLEGKEKILHIYNSGNLFGEVPVFAGENFPASAMSLNKSYILFLPRKKIISLITSNPILSMNMLSELSARLRRFTSQIENLSLKETPARLASYLLYLSKEQKNIKKIDINMSKRELAYLLGVAPETLSRILSKMSVKKLIRVDKNTIELIDYNSIEKLKISGKI